MSKNVDIAYASIKFTLTEVTEETLASDSRIQAVNAHATGLIERVRTILNKAMLTLWYSDNTECPGEACEQLFLSCGNLFSRPIPIACGDHMSLEARDELTMALFEEAITVLSKTPTLAIRPRQTTHSISSELDEEQITGGRVLPEATRRKLFELARRARAIGGEVYFSGHAYFYNRNSCLRVSTAYKPKTPHRGGTFCFIRPGDALKRIEKFIAHDEMLLGGKSTDGIGN